MALDLCQAVATGDKLWDYSATSGDVLYLAFEDNFNRLQNRLKKVGVDGENAANLHVAATSHGIHDGLLAQISHFVNQHPSTNLVVIDTLEHIRNGASDKSMYAYDYNDMNCLREITEKHKLTLLLVHHTRKASDPDPLNTISGSTGLVGAVDGVFVLDKANMAIFRGVNEPIIEREIWEKVQAKRGKVRKRKTRDGEKNMFSGLLVCADCGKNLWYHFNQKNHEIKYFNCSNYKGNRGTCNATHYVRVDFLEQVIMQVVRRLMKFALEYETEFVKLIAGKSTRTIENEQQRKQKQLYKLTAHDRELDKLFNRMYEDNIAGKIDDERFGRMSRQYSTEQTELAEKIKRLQSELPCG